MNPYDTLSVFDEDELLDEEGFADNEQKLDELDELDNEDMEELGEDLV